MANELFKEGDRLRMKDSVTHAQNSRAEDVRDQTLLFVHYSNNISDPKMVGCRIENGGGGIFTFAENQLEKI
jgi:hypothetical protein